MYAAAGGHATMSPALPHNSDLKPLYKPGLKHVPTQEALVHQIGFSKHDGNMCLDGKVVRDGVYARIMR